MGTENQLVKVEHLYKEFDAETKVLSDINLTINKNEVIAILGPSGTGKSTLLRCLNYLTVPTKGKITIGDVTVDAEHHTKKDVIELRKHSSMVFQGYNLFKNKKYDTIIILYKVIISGHMPERRKNGARL